MTVHEADVHAAAMVGGTAIVKTIGIGFGMAGVKRPDGTALAVREADGVAGVGGFRRGLAGVNTIVAVVVTRRGIADGEVAEDILAEVEAGKLELHVGTDDADGVAVVIV